MMIAAHIQLMGKLLMIDFEHILYKIMKFYTTSFEFCSTLKLVASFIRVTNVLTLTSRNDSLFYIKQTDNRVLTPHHTSTLTFQKNPLKRC